MRFVLGLLDFLGLLLIVALVGGLAWWGYQQTPHYQASAVESLAEPDPLEAVDSLEQELIQVYLTGDSLPRQLLSDRDLYRENWDTLYQPIFWRSAMQFDPDMSLVNFAHNRQIVAVVSTHRWNRLNKRRKQAFKDSILDAYSLGDTTEIFITSGRSHFYRFEALIPSIDRATRVFESQGVDPWYAQAILLIESPARLMRSSAGAYGSFQLMKRVAREQGLIVNRRVDERKDLEKSAWAAARLIRRTCIPKARRILDAHEISYQEQELWFRLLVLHVYHAGGRNVQGVVDKIMPEQGGQALIRQIWKTEHRNFGNASQNYSQIVLACLMELDEVVEGLARADTPQLYPADSLKEIRMAP